MSWPNKEQTDLVGIYPVKVRGYPDGEPRSVTIEVENTSEFHRGDLLEIARILTAYAETMPK